MDHERFLLIIQEAYQAGFNSSAEGENGECPFWYTDEERLENAKEYAETVLDHLKRDKETQAMKPLTQPELFAALVA